MFIEREAREEMRDLKTKIAFLASYNLSGVH
jgi:hypothetical protein